MGLGGIKSLVGIDDSVVFEEENVKMSSTVPRVFRGISTQNS